MARSLMTQLRHQPRPMDLYPDRAGAGFHAIAAALLVYSRSVLIHLRNTYASHQNAVCLTMGHVITRFRRLDLAQSTWPQACYPGCLPPPQIRWGTVWRLDMVRDLLVHVDGGQAGRRRVQFAVALAGRMGARRSGLHVTPPADVPPL